MSCPSRCQLPHQVKRMHTPVVACNSHLIRFQAIVRIQSDTFERSWKSVLRALCCCVHRYTLIRRISHGSTACVQSVSSVSWKMTMMNVWAKQYVGKVHRMLFEKVLNVLLYISKRLEVFQHDKRAARCCLAWSVFAHKNCITRFSHSLAVVIVLLLDGNECETPSISFEMTTTTSRAKWKRFSCSHFSLSTSFFFRLNEFVTLCWGEGFHDQVDMGYLTHHEIAVIEPTK